MLDKKVCDRNRLRFLISALVVSILFLNILFALEENPSKITGFAMADNSKVERTFSNSIITGGDVLTVNLLVTINGIHRYYIIDETIPSGFTVDNPGSGNTQEPGHIKWIVTSSPISTSYSYSLKSPNPLSTQNYLFSGSYFIEGMVSESPIERENSIAVNPFITPCTLTNAYWNKVNATEGEAVELTVEGSNCDGKQINFEVWEEDLISPNDPAVLNPSSSTFANGVAKTLWTAEWQDDCDFGFCSPPPEYFFTASLASNPSVNIDSKSNPVLNVFKNPPNNPPEFNYLYNQEVNEGDSLIFTISSTDLDNDPLTYSISHLPTGAIFRMILVGDLNDDGIVNAEDSFLMSQNFSMQGSFSSKFDLNNDHEINSLDLDILNKNLGKFNITDGGLFSWVPNYDQSGIYNITFNVFDGKNTTSQMIKIVVNDTPQGDRDNDGIFDNFDCNDENKSIGQCRGCAVCSVDPRGISNNGTCIGGACYDLPCEKHSYSLCGAKGICGAKGETASCASNEIGIFPESIPRTCTLKSPNIGICGPNTCSPVSCILESGCSVDSDKDSIPDAQDCCYSPNTSRVNELGFPIPLFNNFSNVEELTNLSFESFNKINNLTVSKLNIAKIEFKSEVKLFRNTSSGICTALDLDRSVFISKNRVEIKPDLPELNKSAVITIYDINYSNPSILQDGRKCNECKILRYENDTVMFEVPHFSSYSLSGDVVYEITEKCGDKICDADESCSSCQEDCGSCPSSSSSSSSGGGGGGGGGGSITKPSFFFDTTGFDLSNSEISIKLSQNETKTSGFVITNKEKKPISVEISSDFDLITDLKKKELIIGVGESKKIEFNIFPNNKSPDIYLGKIYISSQNLKKEIFLSVEIVSTKQLFDVFLSILKKDLNVLPGGKISFKISLKKLSEIDSTANVVLSSVIKNDLGEVIASEISNITVGEAMNGLDKQVILPKDISEGTYILYTQINHDGEIGSSSSWFNVTKAKRPLFTWIVFIIILSILIIGLIVYIIKLIRESKLSPEIV